MLELSRLSVSFDRVVLQDVCFTLGDGQVAAIIGESGSGKTTLLYALGLISSNKAYQYRLNGVEVDTANDRQKAFVRKTQIGYVFQDNNLNDALTVGENIAFAIRASCREAEEGEVEQLLDYVRLPGRANAWPGSLSGGERQRLAIACALAKKPDLLLADEPTSALDGTNAGMIMDILERVAHQEGKMVVIATHNPDIYAHADCIYKIEQGCGQMISNQQDAEDTPGEKPGLQDKKGGRGKGLKGSFFARYAWVAGRRNRLGKQLMLVLCALAIAMGTLSFFYGNNVGDEQAKFVNEISNREIFLVNRTVPNAANDYSQYDLHIASDQADQFGGLLGITAAYPYYILPGWGAVIDEKGKVAMSEDTVFSIAKQGVTPYQVAIPDPEGNLTINPDIGSANDQFVALPWVPQQKLDAKLKYSLENQHKPGGVYLSAPMAYWLGIEEGDRDVMLTWDALVPVCVFHSKLERRNDKEQVIQYPIDLYYHKKITVTLPISGVLRNDVRNDTCYTEYGENCIYIPYDQLQGYMTLAARDFTIPKQCKPLGTSAYLIYAQDLASVNDVMEKLQRIDQNYVLTNKYQDLQRMEMSIRNTRQAMMIVSGVILIVLFVMMTIIFCNYVSHRKFEIALLKANGLTKGEICRVMLTEAALQAGFTCVYAFVLTGILWLVSRRIGLFAEVGITLTPVAIPIIMGICALAIALPTLFTVFKVNAYEPDRILRN
nr:ATP-binding cassette domain-containing protein [bacterium]